MSVINVIVAGVSGQGVATCGEIIARAAMTDGYEVKMLPCGDDRAGRSSYVNIRYGDEVLSPRICRGEADVIIALEKLECARMIPYLKIAGSVFTSLSEIMPESLIKSGEPYPTEIFESLAMLGIEAVACDTAMICRMAENDKAEGAALIGLASDALALTRDSIRSAISAVLPEEAAKSSIKAFDIALGLGK